MASTEKKVLGRSTRVDLVDKVRSTDSVSNYLMATSYDEEVNIYTLADLSVGVLLEVTPLAASVLSDDELQTYSDSIAVALSRMPEHAIIQSHILPAANVDQDIENYYAAGSGDDHPVLATHERMVADMYRRSVAKPLFAFQYGEGGFKTRRYRVLLSIVVRPDEMVGGGKASTLDFLSSLVGFVRRGSGAPAIRRAPAEERYLTMRERLYKRLQETARRLEGTLRTNHLQVRRLPPTELVAVTRMLMWPEASLGARPDHDPYQQLATQIPLGDVAVECASGSVLADGWVYKTLSMSSIPRSTTPGTTTLPQPALGLFTLLDFIGDGFLTVSAHCKPVNDVRSFLDKRRRFIRGGFAMPSKVDQLLRDCDLTSYFIETDRRKMFDAQLVICVRGRNEREAQEQAEKVRDKAADVGIDCRVEQHYGPSLLFQSLPFGFAPTLPEARRLWLMPDRAVADFLPLFMLSRGTRRPALMLHNRLGEPFYFNPFDSPTAAHCVICGESGSGKSFFTNYLMFSALRKADAQVFAIDKGRSYATSTAMLGEKGSYNNMGLSSKTCINAFAGTLENASAFLRQFIAHLASQVETDRLNSDQMGIVDECITRAFLRKQQTFTWRTFAELNARWPRGAWIDRLRKRMVIHPLDEVQRSGIDQLKAKDSGRAPEFEIYTRALLRSRRVLNRETRQLIKEETYEDARSIDQETRRWLESRGFLIEDLVQDDGARQPACST
jgi:conjugal transfer ATP-binding protein TraC